MLLIGVYKFSVNYIKRERYFRAVIKMVMRLSRLYGKQIYNTRGNYVGYVDEVLIEIGQGGGKVLALGLPGEKVGVPYERVTAIGDIILVRAKED